MRLYRINLVIFGLFALLPAVVDACSVPVFRYAMERWPPDYYDAVIIARGESAEQTPAAALLKDETAELLNLRLSGLDLATAPEEEVKSLLGPNTPEKLPALALWYPWLKGRGAPFWTGEFTPETVSKLAQSPMRTELGERLSKGQSGVWILIESGDAAKDKAALQLLEQELETATKELKEMAPALVEELQMPGLSFEFSTLSLSRSDPNEQFLLAMLLSSEPDLDEYAGEPILFPVFGRGRALYALVGQGINADNIREAVGFLTGPCGCEVKMLNPGVDLLMAFNWDAAVMQFYEEFYEMQETPMELTSVFPEATGEITSEVQEATAESELGSDPTYAGSTQTEPPATEKQRRHGFGLLGTAAVSLGGIVVIVALGTLAVSRRRKEQL
ncbi:MAG: hypothetical protein JSW66_03660 [Phycisphaerales bacterium]|nr:MAG: hypothetical protein JSW66_03660 [Phycisphaerales bacterium]